MVEQGGSTPVSTERTGDDRTVAWHPGWLSSLSTRFTAAATGALVIATSILAYASYSRSRTQLEEVVDSLGATLAKALAAPDPRAWSTRRDTVLEAAQGITALAEKYGEYLELMYGIRVEPPPPGSKHVTSDAVRAQQEEILTELRRSQARNAATLQTLIGFRTARVVVPSPLADAMVLRSDRNELVARANPDARTFKAVGAPRPLRVETSGRPAETEVLTCTGSLEGVGPVRSFEAPIRDATGTVTHRALVFVAQEWLDRALIPVLWRNLVVALFIIVLGSAAFSLLARRMTAPILELTREFEGVAAGEVEQRTHVHRHDEVGQLARAMDAALRRLDHAVAEHRVEIREQLERKMTPEGIPYIAGYPVDVVREKAHTIGGTCYDFIELPGKRHAFVLAQASRTGIAAALDVLTTAALLRTALPTTVGPAALLKSIHATLHEQLLGETSVAVTVAVLHRKGGRVTVAGAGGLPAYWYQAATGSTRRLALRGMALGIEKGESFEASLEEQTLQLAPGDRLVLANAGVVRLPEQRDQEAQLDPAAVRLVARAARSGPTLQRELSHFFARARLDHDVVAVAIGCGESAVAPATPARPPSEETPSFSRLPQGARLPARNRRRRVPVRR